MFKEHLRKLVEGVEGGRAALLMDFDGIEVDHHVVGDLDIQTLGIEFSQLMTNVKRQASILEVGDLEEMMVRTRELLLLFRVVNNEYFLIVACTPDGNFGKARFLMRLAAPRFIEFF
ncbi:roadblock/LC7 domain-containing protein [Myxococcota bacterium]|jgi:predicted regulator of Ras-like GTPase activity (Roadblock/LC7/MglB family)|nr:roadblock/LC7 domain-containing protein [Myxococcota bacterium]MBU1409948.1 roadblock/LC7 domain-containing protein [Myxococcota bacterium]MBU1511236.1 roadblock/LC7 domain-containing protein [Myxococcota bacterium]PKN26630.1 MAG: GTPase [Deltaproteobacteria bacterium HGW-Deltaproteobacteria-22]